MYACLHCHISTPASDLLHLTITTDLRERHNRPKIYPSPPSAAAICKSPILTLFTQHQLPALDPTGARTKLFARTNPEAAKVGDILLVRQKSGDPFAGVCLNIRRQGVDTAVLLRNELTRVGVEMWYKIYSPNVEGIEVVQRRVKRARRARLYYMRYVWTFGMWTMTMLMWNLDNRSMMQDLCRMW